MDYASPLLQFLLGSLVLAVSVLAALFVYELLSGLGRRRP